MLCVIGIYSTVRFELGGMAKPFRSFPSSPASSKMTRAVAQQSFIYAILFWNTYFWVILRFFVRRSSNDHWVYGIRLVAEYLYPLQGFFNFLIFIRPRYRKIRVRFPNTCWVWIVKEVLFGKALPIQRRRSSFPFGIKPFDTGATGAGSDSTSTGIRGGHSMSKGLQNQSPFESRDLSITFNSSDVGTTSGSANSNETVKKQLSDQNLPPLDSNLPPQEAKDESQYEKHIQELADMVDSLKSELLEVVVEDQTQDDMLETIRTARMTAATLDPH